MSKLFAIRENVLCDKVQREKLKTYLEKGGKISNFTVVTGVEGNKLISEAPFLPEGFTYDATKSEHYSKHKLTTTVSTLLLHEGDSSIFYFSESVLLRHLNAITE